MLWIELINWSIYLCHTVQTIIPWGLRLYCTEYNENHFSAHRYANFQLIVYPPRLFSEHQHCSNIHLNWGFISQLQTPVVRTQIKKTTSNLNFGIHTLPKCLSWVLFIASDSQNSKSTFIVWLECKYQNWKNYLN